MLPIQLKDNKNSLKSDIIMVVWEKNVPLPLKNNQHYEKIIFIRSLVVAMAATGCKKDKETVCNPDAAGIVGSTKITSVLYKADASTPEVDLFTLYAACEKMTSSKLNAGGTVTQDAELFVHLPVTTLVLGLCLVLP